MRLLALVAALGSAILLALPPAAGADGDPRARRTPKPKRHHGAEILLDMNDALGVDRTAGGVLRIRKRYGLEYAHRFDQAGDAPPLILSIQGPAMPRKRLGLCIEIKF